MGGKSPRKDSTQYHSQQPKSEHSPRIYLPGTRALSVHAHSRECYPAKHYLVAMAITNSLLRELSWDTGTDIMLLMSKGSGWEHVCLLIFTCNPKSILRVVFWSLENVHLTYTFLAEDIQQSTSSCLSSHRHPSLAHSVH